MQRARKRDFHTPLWDDESLSASERIRLLDEFTMEEDQQLDAASDSLIALILDPNVWNTNAQYQSMAGQEINRDATPMPMGVAGSSQPTFNNERAAKRKLTSWPTDGEAPAQPNLNQNQNQMFTQFIPYLNSVSRHPLPGLSYDDATQSGSQPLGTSGLLSSPLGPGVATSPTQHYATYGAPFGSEHQEPSMGAPQQNFAAPSQPEDHHEGNNVHPQGSGSINAASAATSTNNSHSHTIFTQGLSSGQSHTLSFMGASSQPGSAVNKEHASLALSYLVADPMFISPEDRILALTMDRRGKVWANWEANNVVHSVVGPGVPDSHCLIAMNSPFSPKPDDALAPEWQNLSTTCFGGRRAPHTIVRKWWTMMEMFCLLTASYSNAQFDSLSAILSQLLSAIGNPASESIPGVRHQDMVAWAAGGEEGWLGMVYKRLRNHAIIADRVAALRHSKQPSSVRSIVRMPRRLKSNQSVSSADQSSLSYGKVLARPLGQLSHMSQSSVAEIQAPAAVVVAPNVPATIEIQRDHGKVTDARIEMANAKTEYMRAYADLQRFKLYERFAAVEMTAREQARRAAHDALTLKSSTQAMINRAENIFLEQMDGTLPRVEVRRILEQLASGLPDLEELGIPPPDDIPEPPSPPAPPLQDPAVLAAITPAAQAVLAIEASAPSDDPIVALSPIESN